MKIKNFPAFVFFLCYSVACFSQLKEPDQYNVVWASQSKNSSESMPCGGGDIGLNMWAEKGELFIYMACSGSFDENNALLKAGRLRLNFIPNILNGKNLKQELHLKEGYVTVSNEVNGVNATIKIWGDVFAPVILIGINSNKKIKATAAYESWRYQDRILQPRENFGNSWKWEAPKNNLCKKDKISFQDNKVLFYHHDQAVTFFDALSLSKD